jgi:hypothetical protein
MRPQPAVRGERALDRPRQHRAEVDSGRSEGPALSPWRLGPYNVRHARQG